MLKFSVYIKPGRKKNNQLYTTEGKKEQLIIMAGWEEGERQAKHVWQMNTLLNQVEKVPFFIFSVLARVITS